MQRGDLSVARMVCIAIVAALASAATLAGHGRGGLGMGRARSRAEDAFTARTAALCRLLAPEADDWEATADSCEVRQGHGRTERIVDVWCVSPRAGVAASSYWNEVTGELVRVAVTRQPALALSSGGLPRGALLRASRWWRDEIARWAGDADPSPRLVEQYPAHPGDLWTCWKTPRGTLGMLVEDRDGALETIIYGAAGRPFRSAE